MMHKPLIDIETRNIIIDRVAKGEPVREVALEFKIKPTNIYNWIAVAKNREGKVIRDYSPPKTVDERITDLLDNFVTQLKSLLIMKITSNLKDM